MELALWGLLWNLDPRYLQDNAEEVRVSKQFVT
jgi:hypothetical protein